MAVFYVKNSRNYLFSQGLKRKSDSKETEEAATKSAFLPRGAFRPVLQNLQGTGIRERDTMRQLFKMSQNDRGGALGATRRSVVAPSLRTVRRALAGASERSRDFGAQTLFGAHTRKRLVMLGRQKLPFVTSQQVATGRASRRVGIPYFSRCEKCNPFASGEGF